jgi:hypothetical protein
MQPTTPDSFLHIKLDGMGPKLLISDLSTADQPILRWRLVVRGNTAVEFGIVPLCLEVRLIFALQSRAAHAAVPVATVQTHGGLDTSACA